MMIAAQVDTRLSKNHRLVYEIVLAQEPGQHLTMSELYELARIQRPGIGFTTVYRAIVRLRDSGIVSETTLPGAACAVYETAGAPHSHFRCTECGNIRNVAYAMPTSQVSDLASDFGGEVQGVLVSLHGLCASCRAARN